MNTTNNIKENDQWNSKVQELDTKIHTEAAKYTHPAGSLRIWQTELSVSLLFWLDVFSFT